MNFNYIVYILQCNNNHLYTGYTNDLLRRYQAHLAGKCKYTRSFKPIGIAQYWPIVGEKKDAMQVERYIKSLTRAQKNILINHPERLLLHFKCCLLSDDETLLTNV